MRRAAVVFALAVFACVRPAAGQSVYALIVGDASPAAQWGDFAPHITWDVARMVSVIEAHVPEQRAALRPMTIENDDESSPQAILAALDALTPGPDDTLIVYYSGHGAADDRGHYFDLARGPLYRADLRRTMAAKGARLDVLLTDCCSARRDGRNQRHPRFQVPPPEDYSPVFRSLFVEPRGSVEVNSCSPGESAFFSPPTPDSEPHWGSLFTRAVEDCLNDNRERAVDWDGFLLSVSVTVHSRFREGYPQGVQFVKGADAQRDQNVFAAEYPGMPENRGPRADLLVRDADGHGAYVVEVEAGSPGTRVWDVSGGQYVSFLPGNLIVAANGRSVRNVEDFKLAVADSPQVMRVTLNIAGQLHDYLMRLRY